MSSARSCCRVAASPARTFLLLTRTAQRNLSTASSPSTASTASNGAQPTVPLDIFAPRFSLLSSAQLSSSTVLPRCRLSSSLLGAVRPYTHTSGKFALPSRSASTSAKRDTETETPRARATLNPRWDSQGREMTIDITPQASQRLAQMMLKDGNPALALRITVENGGCHGFQYLMSLETRSDTMEPAHTNPSSAASAAKPASPATTEDKDEWDDEANEDALDTVFEAADGTGARVVMDGMALRLLRDSKVHFTSELIGSQFKIVDNPAATSSCGCGTSFDAKLDAL